jgi:hypothetical protein
MTSMSSTIRARCAASTAAGADATPRRLTMTGGETAEQRMCYVGEVGTTDTADGSWTDVGRVDVGGLDLGEPAVVDVELAEFVLPDLATSVTVPLSALAVRRLLGALRRRMDHLSRPRSMGRRGVAYRARRR